MKSVLLSIKPKYCDLIANGKKTVEVRKTKPKIETPFKCYIYETKGKTEIPMFIDEDGHEIYEGRGQVIGEFVCDYISSVPCYDLVDVVDVEMSCLSPNEIREYGKGKMQIYGWHISELKIYEKPKELSDFNRYCDSCAYPILPFQTPPCDKCPGRKLKIAPPSYCYVEE